MTTEKAQLSILSDIAEQANIADLPNTKVADKIVEMEREISGFRYQILVGKLAKEVVARIEAEVNRGDFETDDAKHAQELALKHVADLKILELAEIVRWSDTLDFSESCPDGKAVFNIGGREGDHAPIAVFRWFAAYLLAGDVITCVRTGGYM